MLAARHMHAQVLSINVQTASRLLKHAPRNAKADEKCTKTNHANRQGCERVQVTASGNELPQHHRGNREKESPNHQNNGTH